MNSRVINLAKFLLLTLVITFSSCMFESPTNFDRELMIGKWEQDGLFEVYENDGSGKTWDTNDDVLETEASRFEWTLTADELMQIHIMEREGSVPKIYTVTELTETTLKYEDDFGKYYHFLRID